MMFVQQIRRCRLVVHFSNNNSVVVSICKSHTCFSLSLLHYYSNSTSTSTSASSSSRGKPHLVTTNPSVSELLQKYHFSPESASQVASALTRLKNPAKYDSILTFLIENGFSITQLEKILKYRPTLLSANPDKVIKPKINIFRDLGFSANDTADIITNDPDILYRSLNNRVIPSLSALKGLLGSSVEVAKILKISGWFLKYDIEKTMLPNVAFLKSCGIDMDQISWLMYNFPRSLLCKPESMTKFVERIDEMGISRSSKMFIHAIRVLGSMTNETWELKLKAFQNLGFSEDDIVEAFRKAPQVFCASEDKMRKLKEVLLATGKYDILSIINNPTSLICSIEKRYKPRLQVLGILDSKNLIKDWPSFAALYKMPDDRFFKKYVGPYSDEVGDLFLLNSASSSKRSVKLIPSA